MFQIQQITDTEISPVPVGKKNLQDDRLQSLSKECSRSRLIKSWDSQDFHLSSAVPSGHLLNRTIHKYAILSS